MDGTSSRSSTISDVPSHAALCQEVEMELRDLCQECRKKFPIIKEYTERAIVKIRQHRESVEQDGRGRLVHEFPLDEVLRSILMACETFQSRVVLVSLTCLQRLIHRRILKDETVAIVINLMKEQAVNGDENVQLKVLQTIMATPSHMTLLNELVVEQLLQLLYVLHNSPSASVHHTACAGLRQLAEYLADRAAAAAKQAGLLEDVLSPEKLPASVIQTGNAALPQLTPVQPPSGLDGQLRMLYLFVQDLSVMADYDASSLSTRYVMDAGERMRFGCREGYWLSGVKFPRPLCLELLSACISAHPEVFITVKEYFVMLRLGICPVLLKNLRGCFDFAILIRSIQILQQALKYQKIAAFLVPELQVFLNLMLDLTTAERSPWQRATALEFLKFICEQTHILPLLYHSESRTASPQSTDPGPRTFVELVNNLSKLMHQVCFSSGMDSSALLQSAAGASVLANLTLEGQASRSLNPRESSGRSNTGSSRVKLLLLMSETEPPQVNPSVIVSLLVESLFAIVSTLYRLLQDADDEPPTQDTNGIAKREPLVDDNGIQCQRPIEGPLSPAQERCKGMLVDCWASLLSALSLLLHSSSDEGLLQQALRSLRTLLYCCGRMSLDQARDTCLLQLSRYALPGHNHDGEAELPQNSSTAAAVGMTTKNIHCFRALLSICQCFGMLLGVSGWTIALRAFDSLERALQRAQTSQLSPAHELALLQKALESLFETTVLLPVEVHSDIVDAMGEYLLKGEESSQDGMAMLNRLVELCTYDTARLSAVWDRVLKVILSLCTADSRPELRGAAAAALCKILSQALRKGALATVSDAEAVQEELLRPLEALLHATHEDVRARVCEGLLQILQASGQELQATAWATTINLVAVASQVELERAGLRFYLPKALDRFSPDPSGGRGAEEVFHAPAAGAPASADGRDPSIVLPVVFQLLELLVHDFMEYVPTSAVPRLTASIGAFARFNGLGVNSSLTAVGFLWNVADALARYQCSTPALASQPSPSLMGASAASSHVAQARGGMAPVTDPDELWIQIFMHLRTLAVDSRPEVRNCAVKSLTSALLSHGRKVGPSCYRRCLEEILIQVLAEMEAVIGKARTGGPGGGALPAHSGSEGLIVHHSRDTLEKQWAETLVLGLDGARRVLSHFSEESGPEVFAPLAYAFLVQLQTTLKALSPEVSASALKALIEIMRIPASNQPFNAEGVLVSNPALPVSCAGMTSVRLLGWNVLWRIAQFAMHHAFPEPLMEAFASILGSLRTANRAWLTLAQQAILNQLILAMVTAPSFVLTVGLPLLPAQAAGHSSMASEQDDVQGLKSALTDVVKECVAEAEQRRASEPGSACASAEEEQQVFDSLCASPDDLWNMEARLQDSKPKYVKAPVQTYSIVDENSSRGIDIRSMEAALQSGDAETLWSDDVQLGFLGPVQSPTHRTLLHISSARLSHAQGFIFSVMEETQIFKEPILQVLFLYQLCAVFLDVRRVMVDTNRVALAVRTLVLLVLFCRKLMLFSFVGAGASARKSSSTVDSAQPVQQGLAGPSEAHAEALIKAMPQLLRVVTALARQPGPPEHRGCGLWKVAMEALVYLIEDSLPAMERCKLDARTRDDYWTAVADSLTEACEAIAGKSELLLEVAGNLVVHRILASSATPPAIAERMALLLVELVAGQPSETSAASGGEDKELASTLTLGHLFDLIASETETEGTEVFQHSVVAMTARKGGMPKVPRLVDRATMLSIAVPVVLAKVKTILKACVEESARGNLSATRLEKVRFILARVKALHVDGLEFANAASGSTGSNEASTSGSALGRRVGTASLGSLPVRPLTAQGREACKLAGAQGCAMALLPELAGLISCGDAAVRQEVQEVMQALASQLGL